jgi:nucleotide-binding universal stress UspA family protein
METGNEERTNGRDRHLLVAVDQSPSSEKAVFYVADFLGGLSGFRVTLIHILAVPQEDLFASEAERSSWLREREETARAFLARYRLILTESGFSGEKVAIRILPPGGETVSDVILGEHEKLGSCTIVLGREGKSRKDEFLFGSVSNRIVHQARGCSVWIVENTGSDQADRGKKRRNVREEQARGPRVQHSASGGQHG